MSNPASSAEHSPQLSIPIVAIGASDGGLEAVSELLTHLSPTTGLAYVYIQHPAGPTLGGPTLDGSTPASPAPDTDRADDDPLTVLSRATTMPVVVASDQVPIQPNYVYLIIPGTPKHPNAPEGDLEVVDGILTFVARQQASSLAEGLPIDRFFIALADRQRDGAIAVLLSGTASDGTMGMRAIRAAGGLTFAQDETARFQSMPRSAIIEGMADRVLPPAEIARELEQLSRQAATFRQAAGANDLEKIGESDDPDQQLELAEEADGDEPIIEPDPATTDTIDMLDGSASSAALEQVTEEDLRPIILLLRKATGTDFSHYKMTTVRRRIIRRMLLFRLETLHDYANYLRQNPNEIQLLYDDLLINVTTFFRDADTMDYLQKVLLPQLVRHKAPHSSLRIWVPACSTGQEAYSIAMLLLEVLGDRASLLTIQLFATDLSESAVAKARLGSYMRGEVMDVSPRRLARFFTKVDDHYRINKAVRDLCVFAPHNLLKDPPFSRLDLVSCRNLLIYLDAYLQRKVIATFHYALNSGGCLLLGKSETVGSSSPFFIPIETVYKVYARKNDVAGRALFEMNARSGSILSRLPNDGQEPDETGQPKAAPAGRRVRPVHPTNDLEKAVDNLLLSHYVPASVVVNADLDILHFRGSTGLFLEPSPGRASLNLLKMARPALAFELRNIVYKAGQSGKAVRRSGIEMKVDNKVYYVATEAVPFSADADEPVFLVLFEEVTAIVTAESDAADARSRRIRQLEEELSTLRDDMRSVIEEQEAAHEELQSANEEVISSNEELQSINEELETSKEEIESTNEELLTINQELQVRNDQLSEAYAFAEAIFGTINEATLVLTPDLRVKSANPAFYTLFGLNEGEIEGRLIYELGNRQWDIPQLRSLLTDVATRDAQVKGFELTYQFSGVGEKVLSLNARRVVRQQKAILLAIDDITEHRRSQRFLEEREAWFHQIADNAPALIWVAGPDGRYMFINSVWLEYTGRSQADVLAHGWAQTQHPDDRAGYGQTYRANFEKRQPFQAEYRLQRYDGDYHWMLENAHPTFAPDGQFTGFIGTAADVHEQKELNTKLDRLVVERTLALTQANARTAQTAEALQAVLDNSPASIGLLKAIRTPDGAIEDFELLVANQRFAQFVGLPVDQLSTLRASQIYDKLWKETTPAEFAHVIETGEPLYTEQQSETAGWLALSVTKQDDGVLIMGLDITNLRQMQQQREDLTGQIQNSGTMVVQLAALQEQVQARGALLRTSSHDLRGSLGIIQGATELLAFADSDAERAQMLDMIQRNVRETTRLITELLDYSRLEAGKQQVVLAPFDAAELLHKLGEHIKPLVEGKGLTLNLRGEGSLPVKGDALNVLRIAQNVVLNALKYTMEGSITIGWGSTEPDEWFFCVEDTGPGMDPAVAARLSHKANHSLVDGGSPSSTGGTDTDALFIDKPLLGESSGEGIGLVIVQQLCGLLKGRLSIDSQPGRGSLFRVSLPRQY